VPVGGARVVLWTKHTACQLYFLFHQWVEHVSLLSGCPRTPFRTLSL